ncbi:MAG TPA: family 1 glycosylhydrolase [Actinomycetota bacterium]|nr:family 1 glycosylhydrolase [Actinomycetota bacterium]
MGSRRTVIAVVVAAALCAPSSGSVAAPTVTSGATRAVGARNHPQMGVQFHAMWSDYNDTQRRKVLNKMAAAGVKWVRIDVGWSSLQEQGRGVIGDWYADLLDEVVDETRKRGMHVLATLWRTPAWANNGAGVIAPPTDASEYGRIAEWAARRYRGRIEAWEVWNEPNLSDFFRGSAADYAKLLKASYRRFKQGDPNAKVLMGGPSANDTDWLERVYKAGAAGHFDIMATHPYQGMADYPPEHPDDGNVWWLTHTPAVRRLMKRFGDGNKKIWFTEFGWSSHRNWKGVENWDRGVSAKVQGKYLVRTLKFVAREYPYVKKVFWYNERNRKTGDKHLDNYGLLKRDLTPKPAYRAMKRFLTAEPAATARLLMMSERAT